MATSTQISIDAENTGLWKVRQTSEAAKAVSALLQEDLERHHVFFNAEGFHNHITHQLLTLYGTGAPAAAIQAAYDVHKQYQQPAKRPHSPGPEGGYADGWWQQTGRTYLGRQAYYPDLLRFFQHEMSKAGAKEAGWQAVLAQWLFAGTPTADDLLVRLYAGFLHPLIQLQYGVVWAQPAIVAQGLAQACVHRPEGVGEYLLEAERRAAAAHGDEGEPLSLYALFQEVAACPSLAAAVRPGDDNKVRDGVLARAREPMLAVAARVHVRPEAAELAARTAEMAEACVAVAAAAAVRPGKPVKFDFFLIHHINAIPFFLSIGQQPWLSLATKARLLEWKIRMDLLQYAARACPPLDREGIRAYGGHAKTDAPAACAPGISPAATAAAARLFSLATDDGHAAKLVYATGLAEQAVRPYANAPWRQLGGAGDNNKEALWDRIYRMQTDSVLAPGPTWVRTAGLAEAWEGMEDEPADEPRE